jgi:hypothetical protein
MGCERFNHLKKEMNKLMQPLQPKDQFLLSTAKGDPNLCILHETKLRQHRNRFQEHTEGPEDLTKVTKSCERVDYQGKDNTRHHLQQGLKKIKLMQRQTNNRDIISRNQGFIN